MKVLITGAAGFIGSYLFRAFEREGHEVLGIDNFNNYYDHNLKKLRVLNLIREASEDKIFNIDIKNLKALESIFEKNKFEVIIHLAAQAGVRLDASQYVDSNVTGFLNVIKCAENYGVKNFLFASSSSVYGAFSKVPYKEEESNLQPSSFYGLTKKLNEDCCQILTKKSSLKMRALRFFTVYGPWGRPDMAYFRLVSAALNDHEFRLFGDGQIERDFTYVEDVAEIVLDLTMELFSRSETAFFDKVNIGGARPLSIKFLVHEIEKQTGKAIKIIKAERNLADVQRTEASKEYLYQLLGQRNYLKLEDGITKILNWANSSDVKKNLSTWVKSTN